MKKVTPVPSLINVIPAAVLLLGISSATANDFEVSCELSTLVETEEFMAITIDSTLNLKHIGYKDISIILSSEVHLIDVDGLTICDYIDQNTENTSLCIMGLGDIKIELEGEVYTAEEIAAEHSFHEAVLNSNLSKLDENTVNGLLKQIFPCYAKAA